MLQDARHVRCYNNHVITYKVCYKEEIRLAREDVYIVGKLFIVVDRITSDQDQSTSHSFLHVL